MMIVKTKKMHNRGVIKVLGNGDIKEVLINENIMNPEKKVISICFRGRNSSGIVELNETEAEDLSKTLGSLAKLVKGARVLKSTK